MCAATCWSQSSRSDFDFNPSAAASPSTESSDNCARLCRASAINPVKVSWRANHEHGGLHEQTRSQGIQHVAHVGHAWATPSAATPCADSAIS